MEKSNIRDLLWQFTDLNPDPDVVRMRQNGGERHHGKVSQELIRTFQTWLVSSEIYIYVPKLNKKPPKQADNGYFT